MPKVISSEDVEACKTEITNDKSREFYDRRLVLRLIATIDQLTADKVALVDMIQDIVSDAYTDRVDDTIEKVSTLISEHGGK